MYVLAPELVARAIKLVESGETCKAAAAQVGISRRSVGNYLQARGVKMRNRATPRTRPKGIDVTVKDGRGVDVSKCFHDIRLIVLKHFKVAGVQPDDLVQDVCETILHYNTLQGSAYDP